MVEFKVVVNDVKDGKSHQIQISGGTDKNGFPMRNDLSGSGRRSLLLSKSKGFHPSEKGLRHKKSIRGNTINQDLVQINMKVDKHGSKPIQDLLKPEESSGKEDKEEQ